MEANKMKNFLITVVAGMTLVLFVLILLKNDKQVVVLNPPVVFQPPVNPNPIVPPPKQFTFDEAVASITEAEMRKTMSFLASDELEGRMSGKRGNIVAADYIKKQYESYGLQTELQKFPVDRVNPGPKNERGDNFTQNIIAWIDGCDSQLKDEIVVVGAHMDHIGYGPAMSMAPQRREIHPGADDNASGTVALLEVAQAFSLLRNQVRRTVVFQSYSAEEMGLIGSRYYCNNPTFPRNNPDIRKHVFMCNSDMVGHLGEGQYSVNFFSGNSSADVNRYIKELDDKYSFGKRITTQGASGSDHASFYNKKVPVAFLHTGMHRMYHTPDDKPDTLNYQGIEKVARYTFELVWKVTQADAKPKFNYEDFEEMEYTHDHGHPEVEFYIHRYYKHK